MEGKKLLHSIRLKNLLSYGSEGVELELEPLNVLIGPNASGKSNLIDAMEILAAAPRSLPAAFREGSGTTDWLWKGKRQGSWAEIEVNLEGSLIYHLKFKVAGAKPWVKEEFLRDEESFYFRRDAMKALLPSPDKAELSDDGKSDVTLKIHLQDSLLSQIQDSQNHPLSTYVGESFGAISFFRGWPFGRSNLLRNPQEANLPNDFLLGDGSNLGLVLNDLQNRKVTKRLLLEKLRLLYDGVEDVTTRTQGGTIQIFFHEEGLDAPVPASRLSDGTLQYLCLLVILLHPKPPSLICLEEPELGLHPDVIPKVTDLLLDAVQRTQLIVTTHSETLVSRFSEVPESVVVCERDDRGTHLRRLEPEKLKVWLDDYSLGDLWAKGEIGGNRW